VLNVDFSKLDGVVPVIIQDARTLEVLMQSFMNKEALDLSIATGYAHYYSRKRNKVWKKGEISGYLQEIKEIRIDCDNDSLLMKVRQIGDAACHEGYSSCYFRVLKDGDVVADGMKVFNPKNMYR